VLSLVTFFARAKKVTRVRAAARFLTQLPRSGTTSEITKPAEP
jgi:hypothetical protein